jgi:hypothetical protein
MTPGNGHDKPFLVPPRAMVRATLEWCASMVNFRADVLWAQGEKALATELHAFAAELRAISKMLPP